MISKIHIHIAILVCDTPIQPVLEQYGDYFAMFQELLKQGYGDLDAFEKHSRETTVEFSEYQMVDNNEFPDLKSVDAVLLTGSKYDAWSDAQWIRELTGKVRETIITHEKPVIGICFGHQILARALGARVGRNDAGWEVSVEKLTLTEAGEKLFGKNTLCIQQMHRDIVLNDAPAGCVNLASSPKCQIQGLYWPERVLSVQGHPEYNEGIMSCLLEARHKNRIFDGNLYNDGLSRANTAHDGRLIAKVMAKFVLNAARK